MASNFDRPNTHSVATRWEGEDKLERGNGRKKERS
jgi:hypothetical protein